ncbi:MAG: ModD protein [Halomonas sp.]|uniref:ModD protein n=1 Tax=Halomonas sp. TaxID=1486246 RepID=UPI003F939436
MTPCVFFTQADIDAWITEDAPLIDLTSHALGLDEQPSRRTIVTRADTVAACTEEATRVIEQCGGKLINRVDSGTLASAGSTLLDAEGPAQALLRAWKVAQNLLEYACGVATATRQLVTKVRNESTHCTVLTTRKHPPGLKRLGLKATLAGGAEAIQFDKASPEQLTIWCHQLRSKHPVLTLLEAGGIHAGNAQAYARSGVDALVTSSLYQAPPADLGVQLCRTGAALDP